LDAGEDGTDPRVGEGVGLVHEVVGDRGQIGDRAADRPGWRGYAAVDHRQPHPECHEVGDQ